MNLFVPALRTLALACGLLVFILAPCRAQSIDRIVPRHPDAIELPELGRMTCERCGFGNGVYALGDINHDSLADFCAVRRFSDSASGQSVNELRVYKGVRGGLPGIESYQRVGPREVGSSIEFLAVGDWNGDTHRDILLTEKVLGDTSFGNTNGFGVVRLVVWWGNTEGQYRVDDTTRLQNGTVGWGTPDRVFSIDLDRNGVEDLLLLDAKGFADGVVVDLADLQVFFGELNRRWGREISARAEWEWWDAPNVTQFTVLARRFQIIDQDSDGFVDVVMYQDANSNLEESWVKIIYGKEGIIIDTSNMVTIDLAPATGKYALLADISGDKVPELLVNTGGEETLKAYIGLKGQRIAEQFGSGNEPSHPGEEVWWGKPWAAIPLPAKLHDGWAASGWSDIYDFGDGGQDGVGDVWVTTVPDIVFYNGGNKFDSLYDGWINIPCGGATALTVLGDIDGSGKQTIAMGILCNGTGGIRFLQPSERVPTGGKFRQLPPGTDTPVSGVPSGQWGVERSLDVHAVPNPASGEVRILWRGDDKKRKNGDATIAVHDMLGQPVTTFSVPDHQGETVWDASKTFDGAYFITVTVGEASETTRIVIQR